MHLIICIIRPYRAPGPVAIARHNESTPGRGGVAAVTQRIYLAGPMTVLP